MSIRRSLMRPLVALPFAACLLTFIASCDSGTGVFGPKSPTLAPYAPRSAVVPGQVAHFYIEAFVDDWSLFMGDRFPASLTGASGVVFVFTNSGDKNSGMAYVQMREAAGTASIDSILNVPGPWACGITTVAGHPIRRCNKAQVVAYYMRLPDGGPTGEGYVGRGSMAQLRDGLRATLTTIDSTTTYTSWSDLIGTVQAIADTEGAGQAAPNIVVNTLEYDRTLNAGDHTDHLATADLSHTISGARNWIFNWFIGWPAQQLAVNLTQAQHDVKQAAFYAYDAIVGAAGYGHPRYDSDVQLMLWRTYSRTTVNVPPPPPAAPTGLLATMYSSTRVDLSWTNNANNAASIDIERAPSVSGTPGIYTQIASVAATATAYSATALSASSGYWFRVRARNSTDVSTYSAAVTATTSAPPAAPTGLVAAVASSSRITLSWTDVAVSETGYSVERAPDVAGSAGSFAVIATIAAHATGFGDAGLAGSTRYWYRVRVLAATDSSAYSNVTSATTAIAPGTPTNFAAATVSASRIDLAWSDVAGETGFVLQHAPDNAGAPGPWTALVSVAGGTVAYSDQTSLTPSTRYWYRIQSTTAADSSAFSAPASATTLAIPPAAPTALVATGTSSSQVVLTWQLNSLNETNVMVERAPDNGGVAGTFAALATRPSRTTNYTDQLVAPSTQYWYRVRTSNSVGTSGYSNVASAVTLAPPVSHTEVYIHAHQDDWELFMGDVANTSVQTATKVVFVYTSAGDANLGSAFWHLRETAAQNAVDALLAPGGSWICASQVVNAHPIRRCSRGVAVAYYMRLPDGATSGEGFAGRGSMSQLRDGYRSSLTTLDSSTTYTSWGDLYATVGAIVDVETRNGTGPAVTVEAPEYDRSVNSSDHPDHLATADLVHSASLSHSWNSAWYLGYVTQNMAVNLTQAAHDIKQSAFYAYDYTVAQGGYGYARYDSSYQAWLWRTYVRRVSAP
jgi:hypothetical protein